MKKIEKNYDSIPSSLSLEKCEKRIVKSLQEKNLHNFSGYANNDVKSELSNLYNNKCAYCENDTTAGASLQVEHYRPKAKVIENLSHPGYYWLTYHWSNLLYSCSKCNRAKSNHFPITSECLRISNPNLKADGTLDYETCSCTHQDYLSERPLIINPEITDPKNHLFFLPDGKVKGQTREGEETINKCKLNRSPLVIARKKIVSNVLHEIKKAVSKYKSNEIPFDTVGYVIKNEFQKLLTLVVENESFSELAKTALIHFEYFFIRRFSDESDQQLIRAHYFHIKNTAISISEKAKTIPQD